MEEIICENITERKRRKPLYLTLIEDLQNDFKSNPCLFERYKKDTLFGKEKIITRRIKRIEVENCINFPDLCSDYAYIRIRTDMDSNSDKEGAMILLDALRIEVYDKEIYDLMKGFGKKHNFKQIVKCYEE